MVYRVLVIHNSYQYRGGEDTVVESEVALLRLHGHLVETWLRSNDDVSSMSSMSLVRDTLWSKRTERDLEARVCLFRPDVIHVHNTFPLISPSLYWAAKRTNVPVVQTLHNFRLICLNALFMREGRVCEDCMGHLPWRGVARACYRGSHAASAVLAGTLTLHRGLGTYRNKVTRYIALNEFCRTKFIAGGLPAESIVVKPNFVDCTALKPSSRVGFLFVGRLSIEKGIATLAAAMELLPNTQLRVVGDGPEARFLDAVPRVLKLGFLPSEVVRQEMSASVALVVPSICYETFGLVVIEAFACGTPVIVSRIGALAELVCEGETGLLFEPGNPHDLAAKMAWALSNLEHMAEMGKKAHESYKKHYSGKRNHELLNRIYRDAIDSAKENG